MLRNKLSTTTFGYNISHPFDYSPRWRMIWKRIFCAEITKVENVTTRPRVFSPRSMYAANNYTWALCHPKLRQCYRIISSTIRLPIIHRVVVENTDIRIKYRVTSIEDLEYYFFSIVGNISTDCSTKVSPVSETLNLCFEKLWILGWMDVNDNWSTFDWI